MLKVWPFCGRDVTGWKAANFEEFASTFLSSAFVKFQGPVTIKRFTTALHSFFVQLGFSMKLSWGKCKLRHWAAEER